MNKIDVKDVVKFQFDARKAFTHEDWVMDVIGSSFWVLDGILILAISILYNLSLWWCLPGLVVVAVGVILCRYAIKGYKQQKAAENYYYPKKAELISWLDEKYSVNISQNKAFSILDSLRKNAVDNISDEFVVQNSEGNINGYVLGLEKPDLPGEYLLYTNDTFTRVEQNN